MTKKRNKDSDEHNTIKSKRRPRIKLEEAPPIQSIHDLIEVGQSVRLYRNMDSIMLWRITPYLQELDKLIGMKTLKDTLLYQILYYLQGLHLRSPNSEYLHTMLYGSPGCGKCLDPNTPVLLYGGGVKAARDIQPGELLMGDDSTPRQVISTCSGQETMYRIHQDTGQPYTVNQSHILSLMLVHKPKLEMDKLKLEWCTKNGAYQEFFPSPATAQAASKERDLSGTVLDMPLTTYLQLPKHWQNALHGYKVPLKYPYKATPTDPYQTGNTKPVSIHPAFLYNNIQVRQTFLAGWIDALPSSSEPLETVTLPCKEQTLESLRFLCHSLGFSCIETEDGVCISGDLSCLPVRSCVLVSSDVVSTYPISVEELEFGRYNGFEIDGNRRFVLGDCTVTHNTTVAKIVAKIYQSLGVLSKNGPFRIAYRDDFIAGYLGQTAIKTQKLLKSCLGGVLFIDEVYALAPREKDRDSFSKEALDTLTAFLSENKDNFCCIAAGYEKDIETCFFAMNKGLKRRFPWVHRINPYSPEELSQIFLKMVAEACWETTMDAESISHVIEKNISLFEHAGGDIETFISKCKMAHAKRVIGLDSIHKFTLTCTDIEEGVELVKQHRAIKTTPVSDEPPAGIYI
jgi:hypothetical protein